MPLTRSPGLMDEDACSVPGDAARASVPPVEPGPPTDQPDRDGSVADLEPGDLAHIYRIRRLLELSALSVTTPGAKAMAALRATLDELDDAAGRADQRRFVEADLLFHRRLVSLHESGRLERFYANTQTGIRLCLSILCHVDREVLRARDFAAEHRMIFSLFASGYRDAARAALARHLAASEGRLLEILASRDRHLDQYRPR